MAIVNIEVQSGVVTTIKQNNVYSVPAGRVCNIVSIAAIEASVDGSTFVALTGANTVGVATAYPFIRCTTADTTVYIKLY